MRLQYRGAWEIGWVVDVSVAGGRGQANFIPSLDGLRAVSIAIVFLYHAGLSEMIPGGFGVTVFFFLSGFLITTLLTREFDTYGAISIKAFYLRRVVRLGPPLIITLAFCIALVLAGLAEGDLDPMALFSQIFFFYNYYQLYGPDTDTVTGLGVLWSLAVEEHFYLVFPTFFLFFARGVVGFRAVFVSLVAFLAWRCVRSLVFGNDEWEIHISTDTRMDSMLFGCLLALLTWRGMAERLMPDRWMIPLVGAGIVLLLASFLVRDPVFRTTLRYTVQGLALIPIFHFTVRRPDWPLFQPLNWKWVRRLGVYSYTLYLVHYVIIYAMIFNGFDPANKIVFIPVAAILSVGFSALVHELVEKPLKPLRARLTGHPVVTATRPG